MMLGIKRIGKKLIFSIPSYSASSASSASLFLSAPKSVSAPTKNFG